MQNILKKFISFLLLFISTASFAAPSDILQQADSLFNEKKFVQAFDKYEQLLLNENMASPAMLLRMAYIKEGLGQVDEALYYLNMYYLSTTDRRVLEKMEALAEDNDLKGYDAGDFEYFISYYYKYYQEISWVLVAFTFLAFSLIIYRKRRGISRPLAPGIFFILMIGLLYYQVNFGKTYNKGIINFENSYLMSGPSAGAKVVDIVTPGHRVSVLGHTDVWTKIDWEGETAYIKQKNIRQVIFL